MTVDGSQSKGKMPGFLEEPPHPPPPHQDPGIGTTLWNQARGKEGREDTQA